MEAYAGYVPFTPVPQEFSQAALLMPVQALDWLPALPGLRPV
jgi:uncharacterized protein (DUF697 family)